MASSDFLFCNCQKPVTEMLLDALNKTKDNATLIRALPQLFPESRTPRRRSSRGGAQEESGS